MMVPPPSAARATCSPRRAKSADKIEGASSINLGLSGKIPEFYHAGERRADTLVRTFVRIFYNLSFRAQRIVKQFAESRNPSTKYDNRKSSMSVGRAFLPNALDF